MITTFIKRVFSVWLLVLLPALAYAEVPSGSYWTFFDQLETNIWDLSGYYHGSIYHAEHDNAVNFWLSQGDDGKITGGDGALWVWNEWPVGFSLSGAIERIRGDIPRVVLRTKISGHIDLGDEEESDLWKISGPIRYTAVVDKPSNALTGTVRGENSASRMWQIMREMRTLRRVRTAVPSVRRYTLAFRRKSMDLGD